MAILYIMIISSLAVLISSTAVGIYRDLRDTIEQDFAISQKQEMLQFEEKINTDMMWLNDYIINDELLAEDYCQVIQLKQTDMIPPIKRKEHGVSHQPSYSWCFSDLDSQTSGGRCPEYRSTYGAS